MADTANQIIALTTGTGMSAAEMTHLTKAVGGGDMQHGYQCIVEYCENTIATASQAAFSKGRSLGISEGRNIGRNEGTIIGVVGSCVVFGIAGLISYGVGEYQKKNEQRKDRTKRPDKNEPEVTTTCVFQKQSAIVQNSAGSAMPGMKHIEGKQVKARRLIEIYDPRLDMTTTKRYPGKKQQEDFWNVIMTSI